MYQISVRLPKNGGVLDFSEMLERVIEQLAALSPEHIRAEHYNRGYKEGFERGQHEGYAEAKVFSPVYQKRDPLARKKNKKK